MKFGPLPVGQAEGTILAHSIRQSGLRLRKGKILKQDDIRKLEAAGLSEIVVAQLEGGEIDENQAARRLASGFSISPDDPDFAVTSAFTGRANVLAKKGGVARIDAQKINAFNQVNPMITLATVPDFHMIDKGGMLATVKVISFGVKLSDVVAASACIANAISLETPKLSTAALIVTSLNDGNPDKGIEAIRARLARWGVTLVGVDVVPHTEDAIAGALITADAEIALILTASATSDIQDVAPSAVKRSGGKIERFGMPVDPGNLLFIGTQGGRSVIGLPGCARSPAMNGTDWVLSRIVCGIEVRDQDVSAIGVGGLLKEIPTRPHPRTKSG